jgi:hypothetical protein
MAFCSSLTRGIAGVVWQTALATMLRPVCNVGLSREPPSEARASSGPDSQRLYGTGAAPSGDLGKALEVSRTVISAEKNRELGYSFFGRGAWLIPLQPAVPSSPPPFIASRHSAAMSARTR